MSPQDEFDKLDREVVEDDKRMWAAVNKQRNTPSVENMAKVESILKHHDDLLKRWEAAGKRAGKF